MGEVCELIILSTALVHLESTVEQFESVRECLCGTPSILS